jgi:pre-peptidase
MHRAQMRRSGWAIAAATAVSLATFSGLPATAVAKPTTSHESASDALARKLGFQLVPKGSMSKTATKGAAQPNPYLSTVTDPSKIDMAGWRAAVEAKSKQRQAALAKARAGLSSKAAVEPLLVDEAEPDNVRGGNDTAANAQYISKFGSAKGKRAAARILGTLARPASSTTFGPVPEDNGSIPLSGDTGLVAKSQRQTTGTVGDGPHGRSGDGSGDFDFYKIRSAKAGQRLIVDIDTPSASALDSALILWDAQGNPLVGNDDDGQSLDSLLSVTIPSAGDYYVSVTSFDSIPGDPFDSGSGGGAGTEGDYAVTFGLDASDIDFYSVNLKAGDVLSGSVAGAGTHLTVFDANRKEAFGSSQDASSIYPAATPLTGGGNAVVDHVASKAGRYYVATEGLTGNYDITLEVYRPGPDKKNATQTIFLDFNGQRVNTGIFGGPGVRTLSPLSAFLGRWNIPASQQNALINRVIATVKENLKSDFAGTGVKVKILNSRDNADPFGKANVSRLIIGGTIPESGVDTIGIAQSIDPGNFETAETALILLDLVSDPASAEDAPYSLNTYITPASNKVKFIGTALGNIASHEAGHYLGNWHVDQFNNVLNLMDQGGNFPLLYGVGADGVGGTADDPDVDFGPDTLNPNEGFTGTENTKVRTRWGLTP